MICELAIRNFKCFESLSIELGPITLLTGFNSSGKSTAIQPLLLLAQGLRSQQFVTKSFPLNGSYVRLGSASDILPIESESAVVEFDVATASERRSWDLKAKAGGRALIYESSGLSENAGEKGGSVMRALRGLSFLSATRLGTFDQYPMPDIELRSLRDVGFDGRYAPYEYYRFADDLVPDSRWLPGSEGDSVRKQVDNWMSWLFPGAQVNVQHYPQISSLGLQFRVSELGEWRRPVNVGYGYTYAFPIVVALLTARENQTIVIDSPEAHLHPRAQSMMGWMLAKFASAGVQIIVESHSDHVLNGVRLAVKEGRLPCRDAKILFFPGSRSQAVVPIKINDQGRVDNWPGGFFDQIEHDLARL